MPIVFVEMWEGRSVEEKKRLIKGITEAVTGKLGVTPDHVQVILRDYPKHNWSKAGKLASEPDFE